MDYIFSAVEWIASSVVAAIKTVSDIGDIWLTKREMVDKENGINAMIPASNH